MGLSLSITFAEEPWPLDCRITRFKRAVVSVGRLLIRTDAERLMGGGPRCSAVVSSGMLLDDAFSETLWESGGVSDIVSLKIVQSWEMPVQIMPCG